MKPSLPLPHGELVVADDHTYNRLARRARSGMALRLAPGLYAVGATLPPEQVARHHLNAIIGVTWPGGVGCHRTAFTGGVPVDGVVYVGHPEPPRKKPLTLPGVRIVPVVAPGALPGDLPLPNGLWLSGAARALVENVTLMGRPAASKAGTAAVDDRIDDLAKAGGAGRIQSTLEQLDEIAGSFDPVAVSYVRARLAAVLGSFSDQHPPAAGRLAARLAGLAYDERRIEMLRGLVATLLDRPPSLRPMTPPMARWEWLAFFEAYFSNFIEGTEFGVDEARRIAVEGVVPMARPQDAHDVSATFRLAADPENRLATPRSGEDLIDLLCQRHSVLMAARPEKRPGEVKQVPNYAGGYLFVEPDLVRGTLMRGFEILDTLRSPLARATAMMALVTECHPFDDGNGRVARLAANAELSAAGDVRIVIPNVYRGNYLAALSGFSNGAGRGEQLVAVLEFAQRWTAAVDWTTYDRSRTTLLACNAFEDSVVAEAQGRRLVMPEA